MFKKKRIFATAKAGGKNKKNDRIKKNSTQMAKKTQKKVKGMKQMPGLSVLLSVILISVIVVFSIGVTTMVTNNTRQAGNVKQGTTAYYIAESGLEQALWVNRALTVDGNALGADKKGTAAVLGDSKNAATFKIQGLANGGLVSPTVNGKYIVPLPWTGDVPWHGDGSIAVMGGCDAQKPPTLLSGGYFYYPPKVKESDTPATYMAYEHPCNWGKLTVGQKVTVPLYGMNGTTPTKYTSFILRLRSPCKNGAEFCAATDRLELNCYDKGVGEKRCTLLNDSAIQHQKGEVMVSWQLDEAGGGNLLAKSDVNSDLIYKPTDSELFEGKINGAKNIASDFKVLDQLAQGIVNGDKDSAMTIGSYISSGTISKPVLKISVVGALIGCYGKNSCNMQDDSPDDGDIPPVTSLTYKGPVNIPYLEYQVELTDANLSNIPINKDNIISAEGQSGPFDQTIQVKVPNDNSSLEYVIQQ